ncbi:hypothetical protein KZO01_18910 [Kurthia zopfii]|uniref:YhzD-like protein n=1 Tax=Kurthia zopfii TaxID=1650 RepID=A0A2U3AGY8_9BACL|nr:YhzD family protein [Kurthia zopfii]PWI23816.1 hypothetical protein DF281_01350 [Kurthia zopfii]TDR43392.1 YhzD-like protein [Kurthia zopfii]STX10645.1 Uncharacterised protein [Kurthia zopfii]VEI05978.1 Uncharacterised protein [Kurthia zopfii]GEK31582.1 hypothetical protein KZO01_18910 [Kurthia zopfii]
MAEFRFTAFKATGEVIKDEDWTFATEQEAKTKGQQQVEELELAETTHRLVNSTGKLILFHI